MSDEQPVALKKRKILPPVVGQVSCIIHYERHNKLEDVTPLTAQSFDTIKRSASIRQSAATEAHRLESICAKIPTNFDSAIHGYHRWCYSVGVIVVSRKLERYRRCLRLPWEWVTSKSHSAVNLFVALLSAKIFFFLKTSAYFVVKDARRVAQVKKFCRNVSRVRLQNKTSRSVQRPRMISHWWAG